MPEVVEVALTSMFLDYTLKNKDITKINVLGGRYTRNELKGLTLVRYPLKVISVDSKGKFVWFVLKRPDNSLLYLMNTFGLEGEWTTDKQKHSDIEFVYDGKSLYFTDQIKYGTMEITNDIKVLNKKLNKLGPDLLKETFTEDEFYNRVHNYLYKNNKLNVSRANKEIIKVLMDQTTPLGSGLGNYLAVESLYTSKISPYTKLIDLYNNRERLNKLSKAIKKTIKLSFINSDTGYLDHIDESLGVFIKKLRSKDKIHNLFHPATNIGIKKFKFNVYRQQKDPHGNNIKASKIIPGRTTYWSPTIQK